MILVYYRKWRLPVVGLAYWLMVVVACVNLLIVGFCTADEPPTAKEFAQNISRLKTDAQAIQGTFRIYRVEEMKPDAFGKTPEQSGIPLVRSGTVWRSPERFRTNFITYTYQGSETVENSHAYAFDSQKLYEFTVGFDPDAGSLRIFEATAPEAPGVRRSVNTIVWALDALWSNGGVGFGDLIQRPEVRIVPGTEHAFSLVYKKGGDDSKMDFGRARNHPLVRMVAISKLGDAELRMERHVDFVEVGQAAFPSRIVDVSSFGPGRGGYTEIVEFDLKPLEDDSPITHDFSADSFRDLGFGYNVARFENSEIPTMTESFQRPLPVQAPSKTRKYFLWLNGLVIVAIIAAIVYRYRLRKTNPGT